MMTVYSLVLFLHLLAVVAAFSFASFIHLGAERLLAADSPGEAISALTLIARGGKKMPWVALALLLTGGYMTQMRWDWSTPWVLVSLIGLVVLEALGGMTGKRRQRLLGQIRAHGSELSPEARAAIRDPLARAANYMLPLLTIGIMLVMVTKPTAALGALELIVAMAIGAATGLRSAPAARAASASGGV